MKVTRTVRRILDHYKSDSPGVKANLARILMQGKLGGTGKMVILPVDQGFEHGPARSFAPNPDAYDPHYHFQLAIDAGLSAYAAPMGMIEAGADTFAGQIPTILKVNSSNSLAQGGTAPTQAITGSVSEALRLGCSAIGYTIYPGSDAAFDMMTEFQEMAAEAKALGLAVVLWSYPRGGILSKEGETAFDISPMPHNVGTARRTYHQGQAADSALENKDARKVMKNRAFPGIPFDRVRHVVQSSFNGRRLVVFSGGASKDTAGLLDEIRALRDGGASGSIIGRNTFQRPREEALALLSTIIDIYRGRQ